MKTDKLHAGTEFQALTVIDINGVPVDISKPTGDADWQMVVVYRGRHCPLCTKFLNALTGYRQRLLDIGTERLPVLWDCDFLFGPKRESGEDTYVLCEINVSSVAPFPESAPPYIAQAVLARLEAI